MKKLVTILGILMASVVAQAGTGKQNCEVRTEMGGPVVASKSFALSDLVKASGASSIPAAIEIGSVQGNSAKIELVGHIDGQAIVVLSVTGADGQKQSATGVAGNVIGLDVEKSGQFFSVLCR